MPVTAEILIHGAPDDAVADLAPAFEEQGYDAVLAPRREDVLLGVVKGGMAAAIVRLAQPIAEGLELIEDLRGAAPELPLLVAFDDSAIGLATWALEAGADDVLSWPVRRGDLQVRLESARRNRHSVLRRQEERQDLLLMSELTHTFASSLDFEDILFAVVQRIADVVRVDRCSIILTSQSKDMGYVVASSEDPGVRDLPVELTKYPEVEKVLAEAKPLFIDVATDPLLDSVRSRIPASGPSMSAIFPIMHESRAIGVLFLRFHAKPEEGMTERDVAMCQMVANATAISLRNARFVSAIRDEQARILEAHTEAERKVEALSHYVDFFESSADGMLVVDASGKVLYANPRMAALTGRSLPKLTELTLGDLVANDEKPILGRLLAGFSRGAYPRGLDIKFKGGFDEHVVLSVSASSTLRLAQGVLLVLRDVTSARATETELRQTKEFLEALIAQSVDAIIAADMKGVILLFNPAAERIFGYRADEVLGRAAIKDLYPAGVARRIMSLLCSEDHGGFGRLEQTRASVLARNGDEIPISMTGGMIFEGGEPQATFGIFTDLRERLEIENDLARTRLELVQREREAIVAQLAGAAAHELNQPLTSVLASVELLKRKLGDEGLYQRIVTTITDEAERMARIVRKIGHITKYQTTTYVGSTEILDLSQAADSDDEPGDLTPTNYRDAVDAIEAHPTQVGLPQVEVIDTEGDEDDSSVDGIEYDYYFGDEGAVEQDSGGHGAPTRASPSVEAVARRTSTVDPEADASADPQDAPASVYGLSRVPSRRRPSGFKPEDET